jgi:hypothetical protein
MVISSRTPEGEDNRCPVCGNALRLEPSRPPGDAPCPHCAVLLWFPATAVERSLRQIPERSRWMGRAKRRIGASLRRALQTLRGGA